MEEMAVINCGSVGWLGVWRKDGEELYRTGKHHSSPLMAMNAVEKWRDTHK